MAIPDDKGGHQVIVRPDTYAEANVYPAYKGIPMVRVSATLK
jgi:hypothetical protein